jgi:hypothetical protein
MSGYKDPTKRESRAHIAERRHLMKFAKRSHGDVAMEWVGGILYFAGTNNEVPGIKHVPKPGSLVVGRAGAQPSKAPPPPEPSWRRDRSDGGSRWSGSWR